MNLYIRGVRGAAVVGLAAALSACGGSTGSGSPTSPHSGPATLAPSAIVGPQVRVTMTAMPLNGTQVTAAAMAELRDILSHRLSAAGVTNAIVTLGASTVTVAAPKADLSIVQSLGATALLRFRRVLEVGPGSPTPVAGTSSTSATQPQPVRTSYGGQPLPGSESASLSNGFEASFASWDCAKHPNPTNGDDVASDYVIACSTDPTIKYLLAPAEVEGTQVRSAEAGLTPYGNDWQVNLMFDGSGAGAWLDLTKRAYEATNSGSSGFGTCAPPEGCNAIAIVLDGMVQSAPAIQSPGGIPGGVAQVTGSFTQQEAESLADVIKYGALPLKLEPADVETVG